MKQERISGDREESPGFSRGEDVKAPVGIYSPLDWDRVLGLLVDVGFEVVQADRYAGEIVVHVK